MTDRWLRFTEDAIARHPENAAVLKRLCSRRGAAAVADAIVLVYSARDDEYMPMPAKADRERRGALAKLSAAVQRALDSPSDVRDERLRRQLRAVAPLIADALRAPVPRRQGFRVSVGWNREALEAAFIDLGASKHEAERLVSTLVAPADGMV